MGWLAKRAARKKALQVGSEVLGIIRDVVKIGSNVAWMKQEIARRIIESDFTSEAGLEAVRKIDKREAEWLEKLRSK